MPIKVPDHLPAKKILEEENIFVMNESSAFAQDIRPLKIAVLNLMPDKRTTEVQLLRLLGNTPLQIDLTLLHLKSHRSKNTPDTHLKAFYKTFEDVKHLKFDGFIITGAPVEHLEFEAVDYWQELTAIMAYTKEHVTSTYHICWGAQAALYYHYGIKKYPLKKKMFGIFSHRLNCKQVDLFRGFDDLFYVPHSRHTEIKKEELLKAGLAVLSESEEAGVYIAADKDYQQIFVTGHSEYDPHTLKEEYERDLAKNAAIDLPKNYFLDNNPKNPPFVLWRAHASLLYSNWVNLIYQKTPFDPEKIGINEILGS